MTPTLLHIDPIFSYLALYIFRRVCNSHKNDLTSKFHIPLLTLSHKESNLEALDVEAVDSPQDH